MAMDWKQLETILLTLKTSNQELQPFIGKQILPCNHAFEKKYLEDKIKKSQFKCPVKNCSLPYTKQQIIDAEQQYKKTETQINNLEAVLRLNSNVKEVEEKIEEKIEEAGITEIYTFKHLDNVLIQIKSPFKDESVCSTIVLCIDISGSMKLAANGNDDKGREIDDGFSRLDLVKHAARAIIKSAKETDSIIITTFSTDVQTVLEITNMDAYGKEIACQVITNLKPTFETNLWAGIQHSLNKLYEIPEDQKTNPTIILLTDGEPTVREEEGFEPTFKYKTLIENWRDTHSNFSCSFHTMGFGYNLNSILLDEIAELFGSTYCFIPDATYISTIFANIWAAVGTTIGIDAKLSIEFENKKDAQKVQQALASSYPSTLSGDNIIIRIGNICFDQDRCITIPSVPIGMICLDYFDTVTNLTKRICFGQKEKPTIIPEFVGFPLEKLKLVDTLNVQLIRQMFASTIRQAINMNSDNIVFNTNILIKQLQKNIQSIANINWKNNDIMSIWQDLNGQIKEAFSRNDWYEKWGMHYSLYLVRAHCNIQRCNDKDISTKSFGGSLFRQLYSETRELFDNIGSPNKSRLNEIDLNKRRQDIPRDTKGNVVPVHKTYNTDGPCFVGDSYVRMSNNTSKKVDQIICGDYVWPNNRVNIVVKTHVKNPRLVKLDDGTMVTPTHPMLNLLNLLNSEWVHPRDLYNVIIDENCKMVYNFVLESGHIITIGKYKFATLGHNFMDNDCIKHSYFGTQAVVNDLCQYVNDEGIVELNYAPLIRDSETGWIIGIDEKKVILV
jgi:Mg-chelatase subunit ChlD